MDRINLEIERFSEGDCYSFIKEITVTDLESFTQISGDVNLLHLEDLFAQERGFKGKVVHGALLISYISQLIGVHLTKEGSLWQGLDIKFYAPCYIDDTVEIKAKVEHVSAAINTIILDLMVDNIKTGANLVKAKANVILLNKINTQKKADQSSVNESENKKELSVKNVFPMHSFESIQLGDKVEFKVVADERKQQSFRDLFNDHSPIHTDNNFSSTTVFDRPIGYAFFLEGLLSHLYGHLLPGGSSICIKQESQFRKPYYIGDIINIRAEVVFKSEAIKAVEIKTMIYRNGWDECVYEGKGLVQMIKDRS